MAADNALGAVGIARGNGLIDLLMRPTGDEFLARLAQRDGSLLGEPGDHRLMNGRKHRIARDQREDVVEGDVGPLERVYVVQRQPVGFERCPQLGNVVIARMGRGVTGETDFEEIPRFLEMPDAIRCRQEVASGARQGFNDHLGRRLRHPRPLAAADGDEAHLLEREQCFANRRPPDAELLHEVAFRRQLIARQILPLVDHRLEATGHFLVELAAPDDARDFWYTYHTRRS